MSCECILKRYCWDVTEEFEHGSLGDNKDLVLGVRCVPFRDHLDRNLGTITVTHDITTLKKMEQLKSDFVTMVAHEIKGPINSVLMQIKVFLDGLAGEVTEKQIEENKEEQSEESERAI